MLQLLQEVHSQPSQLYHLQHYGNEKQSMRALFRYEIDHPVQRSDAFLQELAVAAKPVLL